MKAIAVRSSVRAHVPVVRQVFGVYFAHSRVIRRVCWIAITLQSLGLLSALVSTQVARACFALGCGLWVVALLPGGVLLHSLATPKVHQLIPQFRARMLSAFVVWVLVSATAAMGFLLPLPSGVVAGGRAVQFFWLLAVLTFVFWFTFLARRTLMLAAALPLAIAAAGAAMNPGILPALGWLVLCIATWIVVGTYYLKGHAASGRVERLSTDINSWRVRAELLATLALWGGAMAWMVTTQFAPLLFVSLALCAALIANRNARSCRRLWINQGKSRVELLRYCEQRSWGEALRLALLLVVTGALHAGWSGQGVPVLLAVTSLVVVTTALALYIGLMWVKDASALDLGLAAALTVCTVIHCIALLRMTSLSADHLPGYVVVILGVEMTLALLCRWIAKQRWQVIDWFAFKPQRTTALIRLAQ